MSWRSISGDEFIAVQTYALGRILFGLSKTKVIAETDIKNKMEMENRERNE